MLAPLVLARHQGATRWGLILGAQAAGAVAGSAIALRWHPPRPALVAFLLAIPAGMRLLLLALPLPLWVLVFSSFVATAALAASAIYWTALLQRRIPSALISRVAAYDSLVSMVFVPIGFAVSGQLASVVGLEVAIVGCAALAISVNLLAAGLPSIRTLKWN